MTSPFALLLPLAWQSVRDPREAAAAMLAFGVPRAALVPASLLVILLSAILSAAAGLLLASVSPAVEPATAPVLPVPLAALFGGIFVAYVLALHRIGRALGGSGSLEETALLMILLQFVVLFSQIAEIVLILVAPGLVGVFVIAVGILGLWINVNFVSVLHGFSLVKSMGLILLVSLVLVMVGLFLASLAGVGTGVPA